MMRNGEFPANREEYRDLPFPETRITARSMLNGTHSAALKDLETFGPNREISGDIREYSSLKRSEQSTWTARIQGHCCSR